MAVLTQKAYKDYNTLSRYASFPYYFNTLDKKYIYGTTSQLDVEGTPSSAHTVGRGDTLDSLALQYYNDPTKYWIIADFNRIQDPLEDLKMGTVLNIPTMSAIRYI